MDLSTESLVLDPTSIVSEATSTVALATKYLANPTTPAFEDDFKWIQAYIAIHVASLPSRRYSYILWILIGLVFFTVAFLHLTGTSTGSIGARWNKWALRRRTIRKQHARMVAWRMGGTPKPYSLPPNGQILALGGLLATTLVLCLVGPDYIFPGAGVTEFRRELKTADGEPFKLSEFFPFQPQYSIHKAWWTSANRTGTIAFALFPLCILFGLKQAPFAIFANPFTLQFHFDKLVWLHRWTGRLIWFVTTLHVTFWCIQMVNDKRDDRGRITLPFAFLHINFIYGWTAFGCLTSIIVFSIPIIRTKYYETFYALHVLFIPLTLIFSALHHPPIGWWCWTALILWVGERLWRLARWIHINTFLFSKPTPPLKTPISPDPRLSVANRERENWEMKDIHSRHSSYDQKGGYGHGQRLSYDQKAAYGHDRRISYDQKNGHGHHHTRSESETTLYKALVPYARVAYAPPPGFAHAQVLSGRTIRLTFTSPGYFSWAPGQHFIITVPYISKFTSHPFTCASICDQKAPGDSGRVIVFLIRAKGGFTKQLWNTVTSLSTQFKTHAPGEKPPPGAELPKNGTLLRMYVDGPFGSSSRARWGSHSTVLLVAGGSGVSFGISVLEYICLCIAGRDGEQLGGRSSGWGRRGFLTTRVRFVWLVREFAHIQWCATALRRCLNLVPAPGLQIDIFVTNFKTLEHERVEPKSEIRKSKPPPAPQSYAPVAVEENNDDLLPPAPRFTKEPDSRRSSVSSIMSTQSANSSVESFVDLNPITEDYGDELHIVDLAGERGNYTLDLTNFDGDDDAALPGEAALSKRVRKTGKIKREQTRKAKKALATKELRERSAQLEGHRLALQSGSPGGSADRPSFSRPPSGRFDGDLLNLPDSPPSSQRPSSPFGRATSPLPPRSRPISSDMRAESAQFRGIDWDAESGRHLVGRPERSPSMELRLEVEDNELDDVHFVSECARPGKPKIDRILADEVEKSAGSVIVGCCGPSSLNALIRRSIALQIDPSRIQQGDQRGMISLVSEEFAY